MKNTIVHIKADDKEYPLVFNLNVMEELQDRYGSLDNWGELTKGNGEPKIKELKTGIMIMINEAIDIENEEKGTNEPMLSERQVGRLMSAVGIDVIVKKIQEITMASAKSDDNTGKNE